MHRWNDERIKYNEAVQAKAEADEPVQMAQVSQGLRGAAGNPALQHLSPTMCDAGCGGGFGMRPSVQPPRIMPELNLWNILPLPVRLGLGWVLSVSGSDKSPEQDGRRQNGDREALGEIVRDETKGGRKPLTGGDADTILDWARELGVPGVRDDRSKDHWKGGAHIHVPGTGIQHIPTDKK